MEHLSESLRRSAFTLPIKDPYAAAHDLIHWAARWGRVIERANRLFTSGPRTEAEVKFIIERMMDKFTHLHVTFDITGDVTNGSLSAIIEATLECSLPAPRGTLSSAFEEIYASRYWPAHLKLAQELAESIIYTARWRLQAKVK